MDAQGVAPVLEVLGVPAVYAAVALLFVAAMVYGVVVDMMPDKVPAGMKSPIPITGWIPFLGCAPQYVRDPSGFMRELYVEHGGEPVLRLRLPLVGYMYVCFGEDWPKAFYTGSEEAYSLYDAAREFFGPLLGREAFENVTHMAALRSRFTAKANNSIETCVEEISKYLRKWEGDSAGGTGECYMRPVDLMTDLDKVTIRINSRCIVSDDLMDYPDLSDAVKGVMDGVNRQAQFPVPGVSHFQLWRAKPALARLTEIVGEVMEKKRKENKPRDLDLIDCLMTATGPDGKPLDVGGVVPRLFTVLYAGGTTVKAVANTLGLVVAHPAVLREALAEQERLFGGSARDPSPDELKSMECLDRCLKETLRLLSGTFQIRKATRDVAVHSTYHVPAGATVALCPVAYHHRPEVYPNPYVFDPDRFLPGRAEGSGLPYDCYHGFGGGRHVCLGKTFAIFQVKAFLSMILRRFEVQLLNFPRAHDFLVPGVAVPSQPCRMLFKPRGDVTGPKK